jgi:Sodium/hydrogen exchanger family
VNAILLLMGLLILSYLGSFLVSARAARGLGLPSGLEYVALGFVIGPHVLGAVDRAMLVSFEPLAHVALGWLALVIGLDFGFAREKRVRGSSMLLGILGAFLSGGAVFGAVLLFLSRFPVVPPGIDAWLLAGGVAAACAETTHHAVRWIVERQNSRGIVADRIAEISHADDIVPLVALAVLFALTPKVAHLPFQMPVIAWIGTTVALGFVIGAIAALLLGREFSLHTTWGVLLGTSLLAIGVATRLQLAPLAVTFFVGVGMASVSRHRALIRDTVAATERPVLLPALLLAGASIDLTAFQTKPALIAVVVVALAARLAGKLVFGEAMRGLLPSTRGAGPLLGVGLLSSGALSMSIGLVLALRFPGIVGDTVLVTAAASAIFGELVAPAALRRALVRAGEVPAVDSAAPPPADAVDEASR